MKALHTALVVGLVGFGLGCTRTVQQPAPAAPAARPMRVDHAKTPLEATYANAYGYSSAFASARYASPAYAQAFAQTCHTSEDCGMGDFSCRAREDGVRVCMGYGSRGESCWFDADCVSASCVSHDGHKTCR